jgi:hypothetical protein
LTSQIQIRRGTAASWTSANLILAAGEPGLETDTGKQKIGDGVSTWTSLSYLPNAAQLATLAPIDSPTFINTPTAPTPAPGTNNTRLATTGFVAAAIATIKAIPGYIGAAIDTLFSSTITGELLPRITVKGDGSIYMSDPLFTVSNVTYSGTTVTVTTTGNHGYTVNDPVTIANVVGPTNVNGTQIVTAASVGTPTVFQFVAGSAPSGAYTSGGQVQRTWGGNGLNNEGTWNLIQQSTGKIALAIRGIVGGTNHLLQIVDYKNQPIFVVPVAGGPAVLGDNFRVFGVGDILNALVQLRVDGSVRLAKGDLGGSSGALAIGNATTTPTVPPDGTNTIDGMTSNPGVVIFAKNGRAYFQTQSGVINEFNHPTSRRQTFVYADPGKITVSTVGTPVVSLVGTATNVDNPLVASGIKLTTAATLNSTAGVTPDTASQLVPAWAPMFYAQVTTDTDITNIRLWAGLFSGDPAAITSPTALNCVAFRYDTGTDGTAFWRVLSSANSATPTLVATTSAIAASTQYTLRIESNVSNSSYRFFVNDVVVATVTTTLPTYNQGMSPWVRITALAAVAKSVIFSRWVVTHLG